jgi:outer membrane protein assembly factor BamB
MIRTLLSSLALAAVSIQAANWPQFRGPDGNGHSDSRALPLVWNETNHVAWKTPIHDKGWS